MSTPKRRQSARARARHARLQTLREGSPAATQTFLEDLEEDGHLVPDIDYEPESPDEEERDPDALFWG